jgi:hypothetical protein
MKLSERVVNRMQEENRRRKLTLRKAEGAQCVDRPTVRWLHSVEGDIKKLQTKIAGSGPMNCSTRTRRKRERVGIMHNF